MPRTRVTSGKLITEKTGRSDLHVSGNLEKSVITNLLEESATGIKSYPQQFPEVEKPHLALAMSF
jgi:hypothetical protein